MLRKKLILWACMLFMLATATGQTLYNVSFGPFIDGNKLQVQLLLSYDVAAKLGTSNFVFEYNASALANPTLLSSVFQTPPYQVPSVTTPTSTTVALNVELAFANLGVDIGTAATSIAVIEFDITDPNAVAGLVWRTASVPRTEVFLDDNSTQLAPGTITNEAGFSLLASLPVELLSFEARKTDDQQVELAWQTASEQNSAFFSVERSLDGKKFEPLAQVDAAGNSLATQTYQIWDEKPGKGLNYYRLKQVDFGGTFEYSHLQVVEFESKELSLSVFPNPASSAIELRFDRQVRQSELAIYDLTGKLIIERNFSGRQPAQPIAVDNLPNGIYWLRVTADDQFFSKRIVVQR
ncbi:MAG: T9SS type A sorting domain-containing protein [Bacteroidota bacterium]